MRGWKMEGKDETLGMVSIDEAILDLGGGCVGMLLTGLVTTRRVEKCQYFTIGVEDRCRHAA